MRSSRTSRSRRVGARASRRAGRWWGPRASVACATRRTRRRRRSRAARARPAPAAGFPTLRCGEAVLFRYCVVAHSDSSIILQYSQLEYEFCMCGCACACEEARRCWANRKHVFVDEWWLVCPQPDILKHYSYTYEENYLRLYCTVQWIL